MLKSELTDRQFVELVSVVALENFRSRMNAGLGLDAQGFKDSCDLGQAAER